MKKPIVLTILLAGSLNVASLAVAADFTSVQKQQIEQVVHDYLVKNPEVLVEASQALQRKQQGEMEKLQKQAVETVRKNTEALFFSKADPVLGNLKGNVTLVEFFDYQCGHCREMVSTINEAISNNKQLRVVLKAFPIFGASSELATKAALAAAKQDKFAAMHDALMKATDYSRDNIMQLASNVGLDRNKFEADLDSKDVQQKLADNQALAKQLKIYFTPVLVIANTDAKPEAMKIVFIPGGVPGKMLTQLIAEVEQGK